MIEAVVAMYLGGDRAWNEGKTSAIYSHQPRNALQQSQYKSNGPHPLGRHPFNIITEEIYDD